jgi:hypothetical protein
MKNLSSHSSIIHNEEEGRDGIESERAYLKSIFMFFQHEILWISGATEEYFHSKYY